VDTAGGFLLADLPAAVLRLRIASTNGSFTPLEFDSVAAVSGKATVLPCAGWRFSKKVVLNTSASGAAVSGTVVDFPVLIRLNSGNFNFSQAEGRGADIRFAKADGTLLPYQIERWDAGAQVAEIWVRVDTVYGNNGSQYVKMYWGNPDAASASNGAAVFDTANGFQGVWHLAEPANAAARDATANRYDGTPSAAGPAAADGIIGTGKTFVGPASYITMQNTAAGRLDFPELGTYSISAWAYCDTLNSWFHTMVGKGNNQYHLEISSDNEWQMAEFRDNMGWECSGAPASAKTWTLVTGVRSGARQYLYVNGQCADSSILVVSNADPWDNGFDVTIGKLLGTGDSVYQYAFTGMIDEVRISSGAPGADWIKLCYMNQKAVDALITYK
jgi:biopolymer transport protein ExbB